MKLEIRGLTKSYPEITVFKDLDFTLEAEKITCLLGPSGCGKTTLLNLLAGTITPDSGSIYPDIKNRVSFVFQESRLLPWITVLNNVIYLMDDKMQTKEKKEKGLELIRKVGLTGFENSYPGELSGGMARRVSLARALGKDASVLLMDEPFSSLDDELKNRMIEILRGLIETEKKTVLYVTHDKRVASLLADRIVLMERLYDRTVIKPLTL
jgi:NitT/TauT family transport system ATP-binding protein